MLCYGINVAIWAIVLVQYMAFTSKQEKLHLAAWATESLFWKTRAFGPGISLCLVLMTFSNNNIWQAFTIFMFIVVCTIVSLAADYSMFYARILESQGPVQEPKLEGTITDISPMVSSDKDKPDEVELAAMLSTGLPPEALPAKASLPEALLPESEASLPEALLPESDHYRHSAQRPLMHE